MHFDLQETERSVSEIKERLGQLQGRESLISLNTDKYDKELEWQVPEPGALMSAKGYKSKIIDPFVSKLKEVIHSIVAQYLQLHGKISELEKRLSKACDKVSSLDKALDRSMKENAALKEVVKDYGRVRKELSEQQVNKILELVRLEEQARNQLVHHRRNER